METQGWVEQRKEIILSLSKGDKRKLEERAKRKHRSVSKEVSCLLNTAEEIETHNERLERLFKNKGEMKKLNKFMAQSIPKYNP